MDFRFVILLVAFTSYGAVSEQVETTTETGVTETHHHHGVSGGVKEAEVVSHHEVKVHEPASHDDKTVEEGVVDVEEDSKGKSLEESNDAIKLYRHDQVAGVYRTESGDLVRMYRVARGPPRKAMSWRRRGLPMPTRQRMAPEVGMATRDSPQERIFGNWFNRYYGGLDPYYGSSYYNYNYGYGYPNYGGYNGLGYYDGYYSGLGYGW